MGIKPISSQAVVAHAFNFTTQELGRQRQGDLCAFEASLVYKTQFQNRFQSNRETVSQKAKQKKQYLRDKC